MPPKQLIDCNARCRQRYPHPPTGLGVKDPYMADRIRCTNECRAAVGYSQFDPETGAEIKETPQQTKKVIQPATEQQVTKQVLPQSSMLFMDFLSSLLGKQEPEKKQQIVGGYPQEALPALLLRTGIMGRALPHWLDFTRRV